MIIDCISDLHGYYPKLEGGDLLIVAGDLTRTGEVHDQRANFIPWLISQSYDHKVFIAGNHDNSLMIPNIPTGTIKDSTYSYLCDSGIEFEGLKIWGSPWTKVFKGINPNCKAFTVDTDKELEEKWNRIPDDVDILITHSPPFGIRDRTIDCRNVGSSSLVKFTSKHVNTLRLHAFGHIHESYGIWDITNNQREIGDPPTPIFVNASHVNERYQPVNKPIRIVL